MPFIPVEQRDVHSQSLYYHYGQDKCELSDIDYRNVHRGYYGMISYIDDLFGRLMKALEDSGFADNTVVIFSSDHGDMIGERGMWFKKTLYNPAIQVPLIIAHPDYSFDRINAPVSLLDMFPTMLDLAQIKPADISTAFMGRSLLPALQGEGIDGPVFAEHIDGGTEAPRVCVRDGDYKLVLSRAYPAQLYDLGVDPLELNNLAGQDHPEETRLSQIAETTWPLDTLLDDVIRSQQERKLVDAALSKGRLESWDFVPRVLSQDSHYVRRGDAFPTIERRGYLPYKAE